MNTTTLPLVSFTAATAAAASIVHFTNGPLPRNRLIAFTALVALAALALLVSAWRAGVALVGWCRVGKPQVAEAPRPVPVMKQDAATGMTPARIWGALRGLVTNLKRVQAETAPSNFVERSESGLSFKRKSDEIIVWGQFEGRRQKFCILNSDTPIVTEITGESDEQMQTELQKALSSVLSKKSTSFKTLTFFVPNAVSIQFQGALSGIQLAQKTVAFAQDFVHGCQQFPLRRIFLEQPSS